MRPAGTPPISGLLRDPFLKITSGCPNRERSLAVGSSRRESRHPGVFAALHFTSSVKMGTACRTKDEGGKPKGCNDESVGCHRIGSLIGG